MSNADTTTYVSGTLATPIPNIPIPDIHLSGTGSVHPSPDASCVMTGKVHTPITTTPPPGSEMACLERVTALESQVSNLEAKVLELLVRLDEVSSCVGSGSTPAPQAVASSSATMGSCRFEDVRGQSLAHAPPTFDFIAATRRATR